jgi:hypothetical protein
VTGPTTGRAGDHDLPPFVETDISSNFCLPPDGDVATLNR